MANNSEVYNTSVREASFSSNKNESSISAQSNSSSTPIVFSPYVVFSRGKSNARKEQQLKRSLNFGRSSNDEDIPTKDTVMKILNISVEEEERTAQYFHFLLNRETDRLVELCKKWTKIQTEPEITEVGQYEISETIEQTNLLINKKFERFRRLVTDCEIGKGEMLVTCKDLQGFWDMMYMDIKNCDLQFEKLEKLRLQDWKEEGALVNRSFTKKIRNILVKRKKKMAERIKRNKESNQHLTGKINNKYQRNISPSIKHKIKSMFVGSNENELIKCRRSYLLKNSYPITTYDKIFKTPEVQLDDSISYINSNQTPGRSILKQPKNSTETECRIRSTNKVNFDDHIALNEIPTDEETQIRLNLAAALLRIDNFDLDSSDEVKIGTKRKLFDNISPNEYEDDVKQNLQDNKITSVQAQTAIPLQESNKDFNISQRRSMRKQNSQDENGVTLDQNMSLNISTSTPIKKDKSILNLNTLSQKHVPTSNKNEISSCDESIKVLRNRTIISMDTPINKRKSYRKMYAQETELEHKENESPLEKKTRKSLKTFKININNCEKMDIDVNNSSKKRSIRNIKFLGNDHFFLFK
ncbi:Disks large-associated protein 5 [Melipona quadrifasciata]|uniref:Disks large-associated protein 5 n=1 Tax=Melipona quadrifasciata TaxID=166423 RepID=A0A0N0BGM3_9HYME|nr:Disks large-associated protein 5 [Melipona quadrifasciata]